MSDELVFYTHPKSRGRIARWMLEEVGQPYRTEILEFGSSMKGADYLAINPMGKVPAIRHGDTIVTETAAVCAYLADAFPAAGLAPPVESRLRGPYYRWMFFAAGPLEAAVTNKALALVPPKERAGMVGYGTYENTIDALEQAVSQGEFLLGDRFSAADVYVGAHIGSGLRFGTIEKRPAFERYAARLVARPAAVRARGIDDKLVAEREAAKAAAQPTNS